MEVCIKVEKEDIVNIQTFLAKMTRKVKTNDIKVEGYKILNIMTEPAEQEKSASEYDEMVDLFQQVEREEAYCVLVENEDEHKAGFGYFKEIGWWVVFDAPIEYLHAEDPIGYVFQALGNADGASKYEVVNGPANWWEEETDD